MKKRIIITNNREIYEKFSMLHFSPEIILRNVNIRYLEQILRGINKENKILNLERLGEMFVIKKINPLNFDIYFQNKKK